MTHRPGVPRTLLAWGVVMGVFTAAGFLVPAVPARFGLTAVGSVAMAVCGWLVITNRDGAATYVASVYVAPSRPGLGTRTKWVRRAGVFVTALGTLLTVACAGIFVAGAT